MEFHIHSFDKDQDVIIERFKQHLLSCGFSTKLGVDWPWGEVWVDKYKVKVSLLKAIDAHLCIVCYISNSLVNKEIIVAFNKLFLQIVRDKDFPIREASLHKENTGGFAYFAWQSRRYPEILCQPFVSYSPMLLFVDFSLLKELEVSAPSTWSTSAILKQDAKGVIYDCDWSKWCQALDISANL